MSDSVHVGVEVFVGVDIAKGDHYACAVTLTGEEVLARSVRNDETAIRCLVDDAKVYGKVVLVIDTTSSAASLLMETAAAIQVPVAYVTGLAMRRAADLYAGAAKTDPDNYLKPPPYTDNLTGSRILNGRDTDLAADATRTVNRLRDALLAISPALERAIGDKLVTNPGLRDVLVSWPTPTALKAAGRSRIANRIAKHSPRTAQRLTEAIWVALDAQSLTVTAETAWGDTICDLALDLNRICQHRNQLGVDINNAFMEHPLGKVLASLCGFGPRTGARTLAEIGDPHRFADAGRLASYAGLAPINWQSGTSATTRKSRSGNHRLKNAMFQTAFVATQHDPNARAYYQQKRAQGKRHNAAVICVARKRCDIILAMLKTQTPYQPTQHQPLPQAA